MDVAVHEEQLSQAIGRGGQNVRLASQLTRWQINVMTEQQADEKNEMEAGKYLSLFRDQLDVDEEVALILLQEGFTSIEEVAYVPETEMLAIDEFDEEICRELQSRARDVLLIREIASEEGVSSGAPAEDLLLLDGMDTELAYGLASKGVTTREELAELSVDDFTEIVDIDPERAGDADHDRAGHLVRAGGDRGPCRPSELPRSAPIETCVEAKFSKRVRRREVRGCYRVDAHGARSARIPVVLENPLPKIWLKTCTRIDAAPRAASLESPRS